MTQDDRGFTKLYNDSHEDRMMAIYDKYRAEKRKAIIDCFVKVFKEKYAEQFTPQPGGVINKKQNKKTYGKSNKRRPNSER